MAYHHVPNESSLLAISALDAHHTGKKKSIHFLNSQTLRDVQKGTSEEDHVDFKTQF